MTWPVPSRIDQLARLACLILLSVLGLWLAYLVLEAAGELIELTWLGRWRPWNWRDHVAVIVRIA